MSKHWKAGLVALQYCLVTSDCYPYLWQVKKVLALLLSISILAQCLVQLGVIGYYELNKQYIAKNLCENRDRPQLKCCGKCYLRKQLHKVEEGNASKNAPPKIEKTEVLVYILPPFLQLPEHTGFPATAVLNPSGQHLHGAQLIFTVFHPPSLLV